VTTKLFHPPGEILLNRINKSMDIANIPVDEIKDRVLYDFERSLDELSFGYVDLLLMHWPGAFNSTDETLGRQKREQCWRAFEEIYASGRARSIGVSNFQRKHLVTLLEDAKVAPMVNQIEVNPYIGQPDTVRFCKENGIVVEAWAPFGSGSTGVLQDPVIVAVAQRHGKNPGQVILRWLFQQGIASLPRSGNEARMRSNLDIFDFSLSEEEMAEISALDKNQTSVDSSDSIA
jgi:diketogulonate reductase-like aldo/keto reductase